MNKVYIVGMGPGNPLLLSPQAKNIILKSNILIGGKRNLENFQSLNKTMLTLHTNLNEITEFIKNNYKTNKIAVLASGDPYFFGIGSYIQSHCHVPIESISGISAMQYFAAKMGIGWQDICFVSVHGRTQKWEGLFSYHPKIMVLLEKEPQNFLNQLVKKGFGSHKAVLCENLSYENERIVLGTIEELAKGQYEPLSMLYITHQKTKIWPYVSGGIENSLFERNDAPMTKEEVRAVAVAKLRLLPESIVFDIGGGTGSVAIECALHCTKGHVFTFEKNPRASALIESNCNKFDVHNITVVQGDVKDTLESINCVCDRGFIGGSGGNTAYIIQTLSEIYKVKRIVANAVTIETVLETMECLKEYGYHVECVSVSIAKSKKAGQKHMMLSENPVTIITGYK